MTARFSLGIDLGTSNCAMALSDLDTDRTEIVPIPQILAPNQLGERPTLASALYLPHPEEFRPELFALPWDASGQPRIVGQFARDHGAPRARSPGDVGQILAVQPAHRSEAAHASVEVRKRGREALAVRLLAALPAAPQGRLPPRRAGARPGVGRRRRPDRGDGARLVRRGRAKPDGRGGRGRWPGRVTLLEEPQAAFYAWAEQAGRHGATRSTPGDIILVATSAAALPTSA